MSLPNDIPHDSGPSPIEVSGLGSKLGPVLVQLPPGFAFDDVLARSFFDDLRARLDGEVVLEPRLLAAAWLAAGLLLRL